TLGPFWFRMGDLRDTVATPDFAEILQAFLARIQPVDGVFEVPFILHSDALARMRVTLDIEYYLEQSMLDPQLRQVTLPFDYSAVPAAQPAPIKAALPLNACALPGATSAQVFGRFDGSRVIHGPVGATVVRETVRIDADHAFAHPILLGDNQTA